MENQEFYYYLKIFREIKFDRLKSLKIGQFDNFGGFEFRFFENGSLWQLLKCLNMAFCETLDLPNYISSKNKWHGSKILEIPHCAKSIYWDILPESRIIILFLSTPEVLHFSKM